MSLQGLARETFLHDFHVLFLACGLNEKKDEALADCWAQRLNQLGALIDCVEWHLLVFSIYCDIDEKSTAIVFSY